MTYQQTKLDRHRERAGRKRKAAHRLLTRAAAAYRRAPDDEQRKLIADGLIDQFEMIEGKNNGSYSSQDTNNAQRGWGNGISPRRVCSPHPRG